MTYKYSRKAKIEEKKNTKKAILFTILTIVLLVVFYFIGLPSFVKFAAFLTDLRSTTTPAETSDTTPPSLPRFDVLPKYTNQEEIKIKGKTEPGVNVKIFINGDEGIILSDSEGEFTYDYILREGENVLSALAYDNSGNESQETKTHIVIYDNQPPELSIDKPEDGREFYGSTERQVVIEGSTEEEASVNINGRIVIVDSNGKFTFATTLSEGENNFKIKAQDKAGNSTEESLLIKYTP